MFNSINEMEEEEEEENTKKYRNSSRAQFLLSTKKYWEIQGFV